MPHLRQKWQIYPKTFACIGNDWDRFSVGSTILFYRNSAKKNRCPNRDEGHSTGAFVYLVCVIYIFDKQKTIMQLAGMVRYYNPRGYYRLMYFEGTDSPILILIYNR